MLRLARAYSGCLAFTGLGDWDRSRSFLQDTEYGCTEYGVRSTEYFGYVLLLVSNTRRPLEVDHTARTRFPVWSV